MTSTSAIVLAAGEGRRLRPLTRHRPKPMLPAVTRPILEYVLDALVEAGVDDITVVVGYGRTRVQSHFGSTYRDASLTYVVQEKRLGGGHALLAAEPAVDESCLVVNGDQLLDRRLVEEVLSGHEGGDAVATLGLIRREDVSEYGGVLLSGDQVTEIVERPRDDRGYLLNAGVYALEPRAFDAVREAEPRAGEHSLVDGLSALVEAGETVRGVVSGGIWIDATYPWDLLRIADALLDRDRIGRHVAPSARVHDSATVHESAVLAEDCVVGAGAAIGPNTCLGENVTVGAGAVVEHSVLDADTRVGQNATVLDCVTGRGVRIGPASAIVGGPGDVHVDDRIHKDEDLGAVIADRTRDEGGVTYSPGTVVGAESLVHAGATVGGTIEADVEVRGR